MAIDLEYYLAQARRIAQHREEGAEKKIRKLYRSMLKDLQHFVADAYTKYAQDDKLTFAMLQQAGYNARFLDEIEQRMNFITPKAAKELRQLVSDTYKIAYDGMVDAVVNGGDLDAAFADAVSVTPQQIKNAVQNPLMDVALEKNHRDIIYDIKQVVAIGLMNGDRYTDMARRLSDKVDGAFYKSVRIARTEAHRVREAGNMDAAVEADKELQNTDTGLRMVKIWKTMKDERVRPQRRRKGKKGWSTKMGKGANHMKLEGQVVLADEPFDLLDGSKAMAPGQSGVAGHDINCRCYASFEMMTDAEFFAKTGRHFPGYSAQKGLKNPENGSTIKPEPSEQAKKIIDRLKNDGVEYIEVKRHAEPLSEVDIIATLGGGDRTQGSCASLGLAYMGQKGGLDVLDYRDGESRRFFAFRLNMDEIAKLPGACVFSETARSSTTAGNRLLRRVEKGKEYYFVCGRHATIVRRNSGNDLQYLELQTMRNNGWHAFDRNPRHTLSQRFGEIKGFDYTAFMIDVDSLKQSADLQSILGYLNTSEADQKKGVGGYAK